MSSPSRNTAQNLAAASWLAPLLAIALAILFNSMGSHEVKDGLPNMFGRANKILTGGIPILLMFIGLAGGIAALIMMYKHGPKGVLLPAIIGIVLNTTLLLLAIVGLVLVMMALSHRNSTSTNQTLTQLNQQALKLLNTAQNEVGGAAPQTMNQLGNMRKTLGQAAAKESAADGKAMQIMADLLGPLETVGREHEQALQKFNQAGGIDAGTLKSVQDIDDRLELVAQWQPITERFIQVVNGMTADLDRRLTAAQLPPQVAQAAKNGFSSKWGKNKEQVLKIREMDRQLLGDFHTMLTLLREHWGQWKIDQDGRLRFDNNTVLVQYQAVNNQMQETAAAQEALQKQFLAQQRAALEKNMTPPPNP